MRSQMSPSDRSLTVETSWRVPVVKMREAGVPVSPRCGSTRLYRWKSVGRRRSPDAKEATFPTENQKRPAEARPIAGMFGLFAAAISIYYHLIRPISVHYQLAAMFPDRSCPLPVARPSVKME